MLIAALLVLGMQGAPPAPSPVPSPVAKASPGPAGDNKGVAPTKGERKYVKGTLGAFDPDNGTVRFVDEGGRSLVWPIDRRLAATASARAEALAKTLQPGQPVTVVYHEDEGQPVVVDIKRRGGGERREGER